MFATLLTIALVGHRALPRRRRRRAPARRRPLSPPDRHRRSSCRHRVPRRIRLAVAVVLAAVARRRLRHGHQLGAAGLRRPVADRRHRLARRDRGARPSSSSGSATSRASSSPSSTSPSRTATTRDAGLDVEFQNKIDPDLDPARRPGRHRHRDRRRDRASSRPSARHPGRVRGDDLRQVPERSCSPRRRRGSRPRPTSRARRSGSRASYGSCWIMLQALLASAKLTPDDVDDRRVPGLHARSAAVEQGAVDAATGFANNEPVQLELHGGTPVVLRIDDITPLPGPGLIAAHQDPRRQARRDRRVRGGDAPGDGARSRPTRRSGWTPAIRAVPELATTRTRRRRSSTRPSIAWTGPVQQARRPRRDRHRDGWTTSIDVPRHARAGQDPGHGRPGRARRPAAAARMTAAGERAGPAVRRAPVVVAARGAGRRDRGRPGPGLVRGRAPAARHHDRGHRHRRWRLHRAVDGDPDRGAGARRADRPARGRHLRRRAVRAERRVRHRLVGRAAHADRAARTGAGRRGGPGDRRRGRRDRPVVRRERRRTPGTRSAARCPSAPPPPRTTSGRRRSRRAATPGSATATSPSTPRRSRRTSPRR